MFSTFHAIKKFYYKNKDKLEKMTTKNLREKNMILHLWNMYDAVKKKH